MGREAGRRSSWCTPGVSGGQEGRAGVYLPIIHYEELKEGDESRWQIVERIRIVFGLAEFRVCESAGLLRCDDQT